jgi:DNA-binding NtrC family response regulator
MADVYRAVHQRLGTTLDRWLPEGCYRMMAVAPSDRETVTFAMLYRLLLDTVPALDHLIEEQRGEVGQSGVEFREGENLMQRLSEMGYSGREAARRVGVFFQIRRAYYELDRRLVGRSEGMEELRRRLWRNIFTADIRWYVQGLWERMEDFSLLLLGETGTGKGMAASAVGRSVYIPYDPRRRAFVVEVGEAFQEVNLSAFAPGVLESELFGHRKGAFTGAVEDARGVLAECPAYGSVFLDEVGELSESVQVKLLRVLQERRFTPVGSREERRFAGRVIAATNRPLEELMSGKGLRRDFLYRISSDRIEVPTLRERLSGAPDELRFLGGHLLERMTGWAGGEEKEQVLTCLEEGVPEGYGWPGNVRELEQALRRILLTGHPGIVPESRVESGPEHLQPVVPPGLRRMPVTARAEVLLRLYEAYGTYAETARRTGLDRRTVKRWIEEADGGADTA